jgi:glycyl-tRNA synthetase beta chain
MPRDLLLEIGTEEIPAGFLAAALPEIERLGAEVLAAQRLEHGGATALGSPRRLVLSVAAVADRQPDLEEEVVGPPAQVAFDAEGNPTRAAAGFAAKNGVEVSALSRREVDGKKGEYVVCTRREPGRPAEEVLAAPLSALIANLPWPKSMRWGQGEVAFVRPVHWIVCLLGDQVLPVSFAGIDAGAESRGHRFLSPEPVRVRAARGEYESALREKLVVVDPEVRRTMIAAELRRLEGETGATVRADPELVAEVANLVEYPLGIAGSFEARYLEVPEAVVVSAMRSHQRYFAMEDAEGRLTNRFAAIAGTIVRDAAVIARGNERVLAARLADARFFYDEDLATSLDSLVGRLDDVVFHRRLGSIGDKVRRVAALAGVIAEELGEDRAAAVRAAELAKADLVSRVVYEFPDLQGVMGRAYASAAGEPQEVAAAIEEHYLPRGAGGPLPTAPLGAIVGIADRIDTLVGGFAANLAPTGSADPFGLRRAALGILTILLDRGWSLPIGHLAAGAAAGLRGTLEVSEATEVEVVQFLRTRLKGLLNQNGELPVDCVEAALAAGADDIPDARARADALASLRRRADFEPLAVAFKRVANILKGQETPGGGADPDPAAFVADDERVLWDAFSEIRARAETHLAGGDYHQALAVLAELKSPVDRFFDAVLVMDDDRAIRENRLALLGSINATFTRIADFRQLAV